MSDRLPRRGDWMGYEGAYICGRGWVPFEEARAWFRSLETDESGATLVVNAQEKHDKNPGPHCPVEELKP